MNRRRTAWAVLAVATVALACVLGLYRATEAAAPSRGQEPFANPVEQRSEMVEQLKQIAGLLKEQNALLKEQNAMLRSGEVKVIVTLPK